MEELIAFLTVLDTLSPLAVIALLAVIVFMLVRARAKNLVDVPDKIDTTTLFHVLPVMANDIREMTASLQRLEVKIGEELSFVRAKLTNGHKP